MSRWGRASVPAVALALFWAGRPGAAEEPPLTLPEPPDASAVRFKADSFEYRGSTSGARARMELKGSVEIVESTWTLRAGEAFVDLETRRCRAGSGFELDDGLTVLRGQSGNFDLEGHTGEVSDVRGEYPPWRIWARSGELDGSRTGLFRKAHFTSCDGNPPDYHFRASRVKIEPGKRLSARNVRFYIGKIPIFYSPFLWKSLDPDRWLRTKLSPAYDNRNGGAARTTTELDLGKAVYGKLLLDYYTEQGAALGGELGLRRSEDSRGALYGYGIRENGAADGRWTALGSAYQKISSSFSLQGRFQAQSDPEVNNHYVRSNAFRVTSELVNGAALVRQTSLTNTRIAYSRLDAGAAGRSGFAKSKESAPRLDFTTAALPLPKVPALVTANAFADNSFDAARGFQQKSAGAGIAAARTFNWARGLSLTPNLALREVYEDRRLAPNTRGSSDTLRDVFVGFYGGGANLRLDSPVGDWDAGYAVERRLKPDALRDDAGAPDYGLETSLVTLQDTIRPDRRILFRAAGGYDFRRFRNRSVGFRSRVTPLTADLTLLPGRGFQLSLRDDYQLDAGNRAFLLQADLGERGETFAGFGLTHTRDRAGRYFATTEGGWLIPGTAWRLGAALRYVVSTPGGFDLRGLQLFEKEGSVAKDLHDFHVRALVRFRPGNVKEVLFRVDLLTGERPERRTERKKWEEEWFPWRQGTDKTDRE